MRFFRFFVALCLMATVLTPASISTASSQLRTSQKTSSEVIQHYAIIGDAGKVNENHILVRRSIRKAGIPDLILPGDNLYKSWRGYGAVWNAWRERGFRFTVPAIGNHNAGYEREMRYFEMRSEAYTFINGDARFIVLNSDNEDTVESQLRFLERELRAAQELFVFIVFHHPTFTISEHHHWREKPAFQLGIRKALMAHASRITALIVGHDHFASLLSINGIPMIVSGAVWDYRPTPPREYTEGPFEVRTKWLEQEGPHWVQLSIDSPTQTAVASFIDASKEGDEAIACQVRLQPRPIALSDACKHTHSRLPPTTATRTR